MSVGVGIVLVAVCIWLERRLLIWSAPWLPRLSPSEGIDAHDLGFSLLSKTPPSLPDIWAALFTLATCVFIARRNPDRESPGSKMMSHVWYSQLNCMIGCLFFFSLTLCLLCMITSYYLWELSPLPCFLNWE